MTEKVCKADITGAYETLNKKHPLNHSILHTLPIFILNTPFKVNLSQTSAKIILTGEQEENMQTFCCLLKTCT